MIHNLCWFSYKHIVNASSWVSIVFSAWWIVQIFVASILWLFKNHFQVKVACFTLDDKNGSSSNLNLGPSSIPISQFAAFGTPTSATTQGPSSISLSNNENIPLGLGHGIYGNDSQPIPTLSMYQQTLARQTQQWEWAFRLTGVEAGYLHEDCSKFGLQVEFE